MGGEAQSWSMRPAGQSGSQMVVFHLYSKQTSREKDVESTVQLLLSDMLPPARLPCPQVPLPSQTVPPIGVGVLRHMNLMGVFSFKPQVHVTDLSIHF